MSRSLRPISTVVDPPPRSTPEVVWSADTEKHANQPALRLDAKAERYFDIFGTVLLLPDLIWCYRCQALMEVWAGIPTGILYRCSDPSVREHHQIDTVVGDAEAWDLYARANWRRQLPIAGRNRTDPAKRRRVVLRDVLRVYVDPMSTSTHVRDLWPRRPRQTTVAGPHA